jgi:hypothetical protein
MGKQRGGSKWKPPVTGVLWPARESGTRHPVAWQPLRCDGNLPEFQSAPPTHQASHRQPAVYTTRMGFESVGSPCCPHFTSSPDDTARSRHSRKKDENLCDSYPLMIYLYTHLSTMKPLDRTLGRPSESDSSLTLSSAQHRRWTVALKMFGSDLITAVKQENKAWMSSLS